MLMAITREISPAIAGCQLTHLPRTPIDLAAATAQHAEYEWALVEAGCTVRRIDTAPDMADSVFVEDIAVAFDELTLLTRPGADGRRAETPGVMDALIRLQRLHDRPLVMIDEPGTVDGGDVLVAGRRVFVGVSRRTNAAGIDQVRRILERLDYVVLTVPVQRCLHLKSAVTAVAPDVLLINREWVPAELFDGLELVDVHPEEPHGADALMVGDRLVYPTAFPRTRERLHERGLRVRAVDMSELARAEGAMTCCSIVLDV